MCNSHKDIFSAIKLRILKVAKQIYFCLRKTKLKKPATAVDMLKEENLRNLELHDSGYKVLAVDRGAAAFWEEKKREVFAMIRQLGPPTIFLTMSAAETKWNELIVILKKVIDKVEISLDDASEMEYTEKARLVKNDPVTCARYFDYRMRQFFNLLKDKNSIFREHTLIDFYVRTEFQKRGSPHCHCLLWLENSPTYSSDNPEGNLEVIKFVDRFLSCAKHPELEKLGLISLQTHKHTFTCKTGKKRCRFDID